MGVLTPVYIDYAYFNQDAERMTRNKYEQASNEGKYGANRPMIVGEDRNTAVYTPHMIYQKVAREGWVMEKGEGEGAKKLTTRGR